MTVISPDQIHAVPSEDMKKKIFDAWVTQTKMEVYCLCKEKGICKEQDGFLYNKTSWMYVPNAKGLHMQIITLHHDSPVTGHPGYQKTQELIECVTRSVQKVPDDF